MLCWRRLGSSYTPSNLDTVLDDRSVVESRGVLRPGEDIAPSGTVTTS